MRGRPRAGMGKGVAKGRDMFMGGICRSFVRVSNGAVRATTLGLALQQHLGISGADELWRRLTSALEKLTKLKTLQISLAGNPLGAASIGGMNPATVQTLFARLCRHRTLKEFVFDISQTAVPDVKWHCSPERCALEG